MYLDSRPSISIEHGKIEGKRPDVHCRYSFTKLLYGDIDLAKITSNFLPVVQYGVAPIEVFLYSVSGYNLDALRSYSPSTFSLLVLGTSVRPVFPSTI